MSWLNDVAPENILLIEVTFDVFQLPMSWLNDVAWENILLILVTLDVSQLLISWLKALALTKSSDKKGSLGS